MSRRPSSSSSPRPAQPPATALRLSLEDEARTLRLHLRRGSGWLRDAFHEGVQDLERRQLPGGAQLPRVQQLVDSAAEATGLVFETAQNMAAVVASSDAAYRRLHFPLLPLASYFRVEGRARSSRRFSDVFYWLIRRALETGPAAGLLVRRRRVDQAWWEVVGGDPALIERLRADPSERDAQDAERNLVLAARLLAALRHVHTVHDGDALPWAAQHALVPEATRAVHAALIAAVVAVGLGANAAPRVAAMDAAERLALAQLLVAARLDAFEAALGKSDIEAALGSELAFLFRHA